MDRREVDAGGGGSSGGGGRGPSVLTCVRRAGAGRGARGRGRVGRSRRRRRRTSTPPGSGRRRRGRLRPPPPAAAAAAPDPFDATHIAPSTTRLDSTRNSQRLPSETRICKKQKDGGDTNATRHSARPRPPKPVAPAPHVPVLGHHRNTVFFSKSSFFQGPLTPIVSNSPQEYFKFEKNVAAGSNGRTNPRM